MQTEGVPDTPRRKGIYLLPNLMTTGCLFSGFYAIVAAIDHHFVPAGIAVFIAMVFDTLDGRIARATGTESAFGKEFDSLADMVSFGLAPAIVAYQWGVARIADYGHVWRQFGWLACFFYAVTAAMRLARFNSRAATADKRYFEGLPSPSAAAVVAAFIWFSSEWRVPGLVGLIATFAITATAGALMVSRFSYPSFKQFDLDKRIKFVYALLVPLWFVLIASNPATMLLAMFATYAFVGTHVVVGPTCAALDSRGTLMDAVRRKHYLQAIGVDVWVQRKTVAPTPALPRFAAAGTSSWEALKSEVKDCTRCPLHLTRTQTVFGVGNEHADWMIIGEAPGAEEDRRGEPFVGAAGQLLNAMLKAIGLEREQVYIANILKSRPPGNRDPKPEEVAACMPYLLRQIALIRPRLILVVGRIAAQNLLNTETPLGRLRGQVHTFGELTTPVIATYHPAYLLRSPGEKRKAWEDLKFARDFYQKLPPRIS